MKRILFSVAAALALASCSSLPSQKQKIGAACEASASGLEVLTAAKLAGKVTQGQLLDAIKIYKATIPYCQPVAENLNSADYSALVQAAALLTAKSAEQTP